MLNAYLVQFKKNSKSFAKNFDILLSQTNDEFPICSIVTGDSNARFTNWWKVGITNLIGPETDTA